MGRSRRIALVGFSLFLVSVLDPSSGCTQQGVSRQSGQPIIEIDGVQLTLGMTQSQVSEKLARFPITKITNDEWVVAPPGEGTPNVPQRTGPNLQFENGRLSFADRYWTTYDNDIAEALFGAVHTLNEQGYSNCVVTADIKSNPDSTSHRVWIDCGSKTVLLLRTTITGGQPNNMVYEELGKGN